MTSFDHSSNSRTTETLQGVGSEAVRQNNHDNSITKAEQEVLIMETSMHYGNSFQKWMLLGQYLYI